MIAYLRAVWPWRRRWRKRSDDPMIRNLRRWDGQ